MSTPSPPSAVAHALPTLRRGSLTEHGAVSDAVLEVPAVSSRGTLETLALDGPSRAVTSLRTAAGEPGLAFLQKPRGEKASNKTGADSG